MPETPKPGARKRGVSPRYLHKNFLILPEQYTALCAQSDATGKSLSEIVREALSEKLAQQGETTMTTFDQRLAELQAEADFLNSEEKPTSWNAFASVQERDVPGRGVFAYTKTGHPELSQNLKTWHAGDHYSDTNGRVLRSAQLNKRNNGKGAWFVDQD